MRGSKKADDYDSEDVALVTEGVFAVFTDAVPAIIMILLIIK